MQFPEYRGRRSRRSEGLRRLVRETKVSVDDFIYPIFVEEGKDICNEISAMPGQFRYSVDRLSERMDEVAALEIPGVILFGIPDKKDPLGREGLKVDGVVPRAIKAIKQKHPDMVVMTDVCLCEYTSHGHCGLIDKNEEKARNLQFKKQKKNIKSKSLA